MPELSTTAVDTIDDLFQGRIDDGVAPGSFVAVFDREGVLLERGFGAAVLGGPAPTADTLFRIASCTKSFTSATLLVLRDAGLLDLDAPVERWIPEFQPVVPGGGVGKPTVRQLMTMSGGMATDDPWADRQESITVEEFTSMLRAGVRCVTVPGTAFEYSNLGYALLGQIIERVSGRSFTAAVTELILEPLGLGAVFERGEGGDDATGYRTGPDGFVELPFSGPGVFSAIGGLFASARTLIAWVRWLDAAWVDDAAPGPLSAASRREMQQIHRVAPPRKPADGVPSPEVLGYGFGLFVEQFADHGAIVSHSGGYPGFSAHMRWNPASGVGVVAFENAGYAAVSKPASAVLALLLDERAAAAAEAASAAGEETAGAVKPWRETLVAAMTTTGLITHWDDAIAGAIFAMNVSLDRPYAERAALIAAAVESIGGFTDEPSSGRPECDSPDHLVWYMQGRRGRLRCEVRMTPVLPLRVQTFTVVAEPAE